MENLPGAIAPGIQIGLDEIERGEGAPLDMAEIKRKAHARWEAGHWG